MKALSKSDELKSFIVTKMIYLITFLYSNGKLSVYTGGDIHELYCYIYMIVSQTTLKNSVNHSHHFGLSYYNINDTATLQKFISDLRIRYNSIYKCCGIIGHKAYSCIIHGPKFLPPIIRRKMNKFSALHDYEPTDT